MLLACAITSLLTKAFINPLKISLLQDKENFNSRFDQLLTDVTTYIEDDLTKDAVAWLRQVSFSPFICFRSQVQNNFSI